MLRRGAVNGRAAIEFNGTSSLLKTYNSSFTLPQPTTFFIVYRSLDASGGGRAFVFDSMNSSVRQAFGRPAPGQIRLYANADLDFGGVSYPFPAFEQWSGVVDGANSALFRNGAPFGAGYAGFGAQEGFSVGGLSTVGSGGYDLSHSLVAEILYYGGALSAGDRSAVVDWLDQKYDLGNASGGSTPPANRTAPSISGRAVQGSTLTADQGSWSGTTPIQYTYRWQRCADAAAQCADLPGATSAQYAPTAEDVGSSLRVVVTATNQAGNDSAASAPTPTVTAASSPPVTSGLQLWYEAESETYDDGVPVTRWADKSGFGRDLTSFDADAAPTYRRGAVGNRAAIEFNGTSSLLKTYNSSFTLPQPTTFFIAYRSLDEPGSSAGFVFDSTDSGARQVFGRGWDGNVLAYANQELSAGPVASPFPRFEVWSGTLDGPESSLWRDGVVQAEGYAGFSPLSGFAVGGLSISGRYGDAYGHSLVGEILYYDRALSDGERAAVNDWLTRKYGTS